MRRIPLPPAWLLLVALAAAIPAARWLKRAAEEPATRLPRPIEYLEQIRQHKLGDEEIRADYRAWRKRHKQGREAWIESMHRAAPGVDWRASDARLRAARGAERLAARRDLAAAGLAGGALAEAFRESRELAGEWVEKGSDNQAGRLHLADVDPVDGRIWAVSSGGNVWSADSAGVGWQSHNDWLRFNDAQYIGRFDTPSGRRVAVLTSWPVACWTSDDEGFSWNAASGLESIAGWGWTLRGARRAGPDGELWLLGVEWDYDAWHSVTSLYRSDDLGSGFSLVQQFDGGGESADLWADREDPEAVYLTVGGQLSRLEPDGSLSPLGDSSAGLDLGQVSGVLLQGAVDGSGTTLYALHSVSGESRVTRSLDGGQSFSLRGAAPTGPFMRNSFCASQADPQRLFVGGVNVHRSLDGGQSWTTVSEWWEYYDQPETRLHADIPGIQAFPGGPSGEVVLVCTDGGVYRSDDGLASVRNLGLQGLRVGQYYTTYTNRQDPGVVYAGSQDQGFQRATQDPGGVIPFEQTISGDYGHIVSGDGGQSLWTVYPGFAMHYPNAPNSTQAFFWDFVGSNWFWMPPLLADPVNPAVCWAGGGGSAGGARLWRLTASGGSISASQQGQEFGDGGDAKISALGASPLRTNLRYVLTSDGRFFRTANGGFSWQQAEFEAPGAHYFYGACVLASPADTNRVYVAGSGYSDPAVWVSEDAGLSFVPLDAGLPGTLVFELAATPDDSLLFAATEIGAFAWSRATGQWTDLGGLDGPDQTWWSVDWVPALRAARFGTYGRGIWDFRLASGPGAVADLAVEVVGGDARLSWSAAPFAGGYRVERCADGLFREGVEILGSTAETAWTDAGALDRDRHFYRVIALD